MKKRQYHILTLIVIFCSILSCEDDIPNPNAPTEEQALNSREGLLALSIGVRQLYSTTGLRWIIETPAVTTREVGITTTFQNMIELEDGGTDLPNFNSNVEGMWSTLLRINGMAQNLIDNAGNVQLDPGTQSGLIAYGHMFKALTIGYLAQNYDQVVIDVSLEGNASFVSREVAYNSSITLLEQAVSLLQSTPVSTEFDQQILGNGTIDLVNCLNAFLARYNLLAGNFQAAIDAANEVDISSVSFFTYDIENPNPIWVRVFQGDPNFQPRDNFGLPEDDFSFDPDDGRLDFYLASSDAENQNGLSIELLEGFFQLDVQSIPIYLPAEMTLIKAEAFARQGQLSDAITEINTIRTRMDDPLNISANIGPYSGDQTEAAILMEIYRNRRAELFLTGMSLEDSRRFSRPEPSGNIQVFTEERNRNFYPFPQSERDNNPNTPADPAL